MTLIRRYWALVAVLVAAAIYFGLASVYGAEMPPSALSKPQLVSLLATPICDENEKLESFHVVATFRIAALRPDGRTVMWRIETVDFDLPQEKGKTVVFGDDIVEYRDVGMDIVNLANHVWRVRHPPVPRKQLRESGTAK